MINPKTNMMKALEIIKIIINEELWSFLACLSLCVAIHNGNVAKSNVKKNTHTEYRLNHSLKGNLHSMHMIDDMIHYNMYSGELLVLLKDSDRLNEEELLEIDCFIEYGKSSMAYIDSVYTEIDSMYLFNEYLETK
jgi:hypothetical protein